MSDWIRGVLLVPMACSLFACGGSGSSLDRADFFATRMISHEMGEIDGNTYLSCRECFEKSYAAGQRYLEADLMMASDGKIVAMHDGEESRFGLPVGFTSEQFMSIKLLGKYTPLDGAALAALMKEQPDWYLVTDIKTDNPAGLTELCAELEQSGVHCPDRVLPQIYSEAEISTTRELGFKNVILTLYRLPPTSETIQTASQFIADNQDMLALTMPVDWWNKLGHSLLGDSPRVHVYVHTVNDGTLEQQLFAEGVTGLYSDSLPPASRAGF